MKKLFLLWVLFLLGLNLSVFSTFLNEVAIDLKTKINFYNMYQQYLQPYDYSDTVKSDIKSKQNQLYNQISNQMQIYNQRNKVFKVFSMNQPLKILCMGDSMIENIGKTFKQISSNDTNWDVDVISIPGSSLIENGVYSWKKNLPNFLKNKDYDIVILSFGLNDSFTITENQQSFDFMTPEWIQIYKNKSSELINMLPKTAQVYWIEPVFPNQTSLVSDKINEIDVIQKKLFLNDPKIIWVPTRKVFQDSKNYQLPDGVHLNGYGSNIISTYLMELIVQKNAKPNQ